MKDNFLKIDEPPSLEKKVRQAIRLLQSIPQDKEIELCYSGGKDSDVILELAKMAGIPVRPIYKCTTIDPKGATAHCKSKGVQIVMPEVTFFKLIERKGFPTFRARYCCDKLKEYKICDVAIQGIRRDESTKRAANYREPQICRFYGSKKNRVSVFLPILEWTDKDVEEFIKERGIKCHPLYYDEQGKFHVERRLGCIGCPLKSDRGQADFKANPRFLKAYLRAGKKWWDTHENIASKKKFSSIYDIFVQNVFFDKYEDFVNAKTAAFGPQLGDCKKFIEEYFNIEIDE